MIVRLKNASVSLDKVHPKMFFAIMLAATAYEQAGCDELWITAGNAPGHTTNSDPERQFHRLPDGTCQAIDLRTHNIPASTKPDDVRKVLAHMLGIYYDVLLENAGKDDEHIHVQYDPKRPGTVL